MHHAAAHCLPREMVVLGLAELALSFAAIHTLGQTDGDAAVTMAVLPDAELARAAVLSLLIGAVALVIGLYRPEVCLDRRRLVAAISVDALVFLGPSVAFSHDLYMDAMLAAWLVTMMLTRLAYGFALNRLPLARRVLLLGTPQQVAGFVARVRSRHDRLLDPVVLPGETITPRLLRRENIWAVVLASQPGAQAADALLDCKLRGARVLGGAAFNEQYLGRIDPETLTTNDLLLARGFAGGTLSACLKRSCDVIFGGALLLLTLPLMALTALAIKLDSPGPALYRQQRVGQFGKTFTLYKFRSMTVDAEAGGSPRWAQKQDPRITRTGRFFRTTRIDELPQLANVLRGEMSMVGPRPERPHFVEQLAQAVPFYNQRAFVKPGLTGWAQVNYPYGASIEDAHEKLSYDLYYAKHRSFALDIIILLSTVRVVLFRDGAR